MDGTIATPTARLAPLAWRRLVLAAGLGLGLTLSPDTMPENAVVTTVQAAPLVGSADLHVSLGGSDWQITPNASFAYRVTVANRGNAAAPAHVETVLHPALANVTVASPGFTCARQFEASGSQAGTAVTCTSWEPLQPGASANFTVRALGAAAPGTYDVVATAAEVEGEDEGDADSRTSAEVRVAH
ncbi:MAG: hypothetical protein M3O34_04230 [Chloroflexota bacterium]|nr:hypothetical protein [Chloroflexota bacterium]